MRYECKECLVIIDEGDLVVLENDNRKSCPVCGSIEIIKLDDSEYGN